MARKLMTLQGVRKEQLMENSRCSASRRTAGQIPPQPEGIKMKTNQKWKESINEKFYFMNIIMNTTHDKPSNGIYSANNSIKPVNFYCSARGAKTVQLV